MGRKCTICESEYRRDIDACCVIGDSMYTIAERFGVGVSAVQRHKRDHLSPALIGMQSQVKELTGSRDPLPVRIERIIGVIETMMTAAVDAGQASLALACTKELRACLELLGKADGSLKDVPLVAVNVLTMPEVAAAINVVYRELADMPDVRQRIAARLQLEAGPS